MESTVSREYTFGEPDFVVRSASDAGVTFHVQRSALTANSEVFKDMFRVCEVPDATWEDIGDPNTPVTHPFDSMDMPEPASVLEMLFRLLHEKPTPLPSTKELSQWQKRPVYVNEKEDSPISGDSVIPLPLLRPLYTLCDKYIVVPAVLSTLHRHLASHALTQPLQVYALACALEIDEVAAFASSQLLSPPLDSYKTEELEILPSIKSLHELYLLQAHRTTQLREILSIEPIFPHGYGRCEIRGHADTVEETWRNQKRYLLSMGRINAGTDISKEMRTILGGLNCPTCLKPCIAAIDMLEYKSRKVARSIAKLPTTTEPSQ